MSSRTIAVLLAGGVGERLRSNIPKQLIKIAGKPILEHTVSVFESHDEIDEIFILMHPDYISEVSYLQNSPHSKITLITGGGNTRNETTQIALTHISDDDKVLFHDAVRPFIDSETISACIRALDEYNAVDTAIESADTIIQINDKQKIVDMPDRSKLRRGQTPQGFIASTLKEAYEKSKQDPHFKATDDCGVVFKYLPETNIYVVEGTAENMKVTEPIDLHIADKIFQLSSSQASSEATPIKELENKVIVILGASYGIGLSIAEEAKHCGAVVHSFSRSGTQTDINNLANVESAFKQVYDQEGRIDHIVLTAGTLNIANLEELDPEEILHSVTTNLISPALIAKSSMKYLEPTQGSLTLFTSSSYTRGRAGYSLYSATKAGIVNLTQALAEEWFPRNIRINAINPQRTDTPMRTIAFGEEPKDSLLTAQAVAQATLSVLTTDQSGQVVDIRLK